MEKKLVVLFVVICSTALGQRMKYKELFPLLTDMSQAEQLSSLREYLSYDLDHPNTNFRLALLHERNYKQADPLTQYASVMAHAQEAANRFIKSKQLVTEQQVRSDNEYYAPIFGQLDAKGKLYVAFPVVQVKIQRGYDSAVLIQQKLPAIVKSFTKSVNQYDKAVKLFASINNRYKSEEDIWMFYAPEFEKELDQLATYYDSALIYFTEYQALITGYPIKKYNQQLSVQEIRTYRLDGLINRMTFLESRVLFWDYRKWTEHIKENYQKEVVPMIDQLYVNEKRLNETLQRIPIEGIAPVKVDKELIYELNNYDKGSLALALLRYKAFQQEWLLKQRAVSTDTLLNQKLELYSTLIQQNRIADSLQTGAKKSVNTENLLKHRHYLSQFYGSNDGVQQFLSKERLIIDKTLVEYQETLKQNLSVKTEEASLTGKFLKFGTNNVPLFISDTVPKLLDNATWVTQHRLTSADGSVYLLGVSKIDKKINNLIAFVARVNPDGKPAWLQPYNISIDSGIVDANNRVRIAVLTQEGCAFVVNSAHMTREETVNTFVYVTEKKEEKLKKKLKDSTFVRDLLYMEESNTFVLTFKGDSEQQNYADQEMLSVVSVNVLGDLVWRRDITLGGTFIDILPVRDGFLIGGNYTYLRDINGKELRTRLAANQSNPYLIKLNLRGDVQKIQPFISDKSIFLSRIIKVNDGSINLLAGEATFNSPVATEPSKHAMVNYQLNVICSTL